MTLKTLEKTKSDLNIGISQQNREGVVKILNTLLADEYILYTKTRNYHWNVTGSHFNDRHKFFQGQYEKLDEIIDEIAELYKDSRRNVNSYIDRIRQRV